MPVYLDVASRIDERALMATSRALVDHFARVGNDISHGLGSSLSKAFGAIDGSGARRELLALQQEFRRTADVEADAAARMIRDQRRLAEATAKYGEDSSRAAGAQAMLARSQRDHIDAMVAAEAAHGRLAKAGNDTADSVSKLQKLGSNPIFNAAGIGSVAAMGVGLVEFGKKAGDFQQQMIRLQASAGELPQNMKTVSDGLLKMAGDVGYSTSDLANGMYTVEKAGYRGADGLKVLKSAAQLAKAENADLGEVLNGLTTSMNDYNIPVDQAAVTASKLNVAVSLAKTNLQEFSGALHSVEPVAMTAHVGIDQVYGSLARLTQSGMSPDQASQNLAQTIRNFMGPNQQMRDALGKLGLSAHQLQTELGDPSVGLDGVLQQVADRIRQLGGPNGQVAIDAFYKNADASQALKQAYDALSPSAKATADAINAGNIDFKAIRQAKEIDPALAQWDSMRHKVEGLSSNLRKLQPDLETIQQLFKETTGGAETLNVLSQLFGTPEDAQKTTDAVKQIGAATTDAKGDVLGFGETMEGLNAKMDQAKSAFGAAESEIGATFVPVLLEVAKDAKWVGDELAKHPGIAHGVVTALEAVGSAWAAIKLMNIVGMLTGITRGLGGMAAAEDAAAASAGGLRGALAGIAGAAGPVTAAIVGAEQLNSSSAHSSNPWFHNIGQALTHNPLSAYGLFNTVMGRAGGGEMHAPGPKGHDSALFWGADGEHVLTHHEVQKMGGHSGVYRFRADLMNGNIVLGRAGGGALGYAGTGPDVAVAESMAGTAYNQNSRADCSGMVGRVVLGAMGLPATNLPTTKNMGQWLTELGFQPGIGGPGSISVGWYDHGPNPNDGHAAMTLSNGENAESGGSHGNFMVGAGAAGASSSQFDHHMFLPTLYGEGPGGGMPGFGGGVGGFGGGAFGGGGGIPPDATPGTGPGGQPGYYTANPERVSAEQERLRHLDAEIATAEKRKSEMKADAKQSERDRLDEEIRHLHVERDEAQERLAKAEQGTFHAQRGGRGGRGESPFLPVPLADRFGLGKGLPGLAEWTVGFLEDLVLGPMETAAWAALGQAPPGAAGGIGAPGGLGAAGLGFPTPALPGGVPGADDAAAAALGGPSRDNVAGPSTSGGTGTSGGSDQSAPINLNGPLTPDQIAQLSPDQQRQLMRSAFAHPAPSSIPPAAPAPRFDSPSPFDFLFTGPTQGRSPGFQPGAGLGPDVGNIPGLTPWDLAGRGAQVTNDWLRGNPFGMSGIGAPRPGFHQMQVPPYTPPPAPPAPPQPGLPPETLSLFSPGAEHHATGGPSGTDTIPAWLSPGEEVEQKSAVDKYGAPFMGALNQGRIDPSIVQYFDEGGGPVQQQPQQQGPRQQPQNMLKTPGAPGGAPKQPPPGAPQPGQPAGPKPTGVGAASPGAQEGLSDTATPGADIHQLGSDLPSQPGIGFSGGIIGGLEGAASQAAAMGADMGTFGGAGGAVSSAMNIGFQELNRAAAYGAQDAGIAAEGILESLIPNSDATGADWSKTIPGRLLMGVTGVRPAGQQNTAGQTQQPFASNASQDQYASPGNVQQQAPIQIMGPVHVQANNANEMHDSLNQHTNMAAATVGVDRASQASYW